MWNQQPTAKPRIKTATWTIVSNMHYDAPARQREYFYARHRTRQEFAETMIQIVEECTARQSCTKCDNNTMPIDIGTSTAPTLGTEPAGSASTTKWITGNPAPAIPAPTMPQHRPRVPTRKSASGVLGYGEQHSRRRKKCLIAYSWSGMRDERNTSTAQQNAVSIEW